MMSLTRTKYTLLQPCDSLREHRDILFLIVILNDFLYCTTLTLIFDVLSSFRLFYIQFKEVKVLWGSGAGDRKTQAPRLKSYLIGTPIKVVFNLSQLNDQIMFNRIYIFFHTQFQNKKWQLHAEKYQILYWKTQIQTST